MVRPVAPTWRWATASARPSPSTPPASSGRTRASSRRDVQPAHPARGDGLPRPQQGPLPGERRPHSSLDKIDEAFQQAEWSGNDGFAGVTVDRDHAVTTARGCRPGGAGQPSALRRRAVRQAASDRRAASGRARSGCRRQAGHVARMPSASTAVTARCRIRTAAQSGSYPRAGELISCLRSSGSSTTSTPSSPSPAPPAPSTRAPCPSRRPS